MIPAVARLAALCIVATSPLAALVQSSATRVRTQAGQASLFAVSEARTFGVHGGPPWLVAPLARQGGTTLRVFGNSVWTVDTAEGTVARIRRASGATEVLDFGAGSEPQDVLVAGAHAFVTLRNEPELRHIDLPTGTVRKSVDLAPLARPAETVALGTMVRDGATLFVQVTVVGGFAYGEPYDDRGVLAVVDAVNEVLLDADPLAPGIQGIALAGAPPHFDMQIVPETRTLFVSTTDGWLDGRGGIEMVDLDAWRSVGFALHEKTIADLGGFVMTSPEGGYFVFHTDLLASTHLKPFTIAGGPAPGPEMVVFFDIVDQLAYDARRRHVYLAGGFVSPVVHVFDSRTDEPVGDGLISMPALVHDVVVP